MASLCNNPAPARRHDLQQRATIWLNIFLTVNLSPAYKYDKITV